MNLGSSVKTRDTELGKKQLLKKYIRTIAFNFYKLQVFVRGRIPLKDDKCSVRAHMCVLGYDCYKHQRSCRCGTTFEKVWIEVGRF